MDVLQFLLYTLLVLVIIVLLIDYVPRLSFDYRLAKTMPNPGLGRVWLAIRFLCALTPAMCHSLPREWAKQFKQTYCVWVVGRFTLQVFKASVMQTILCSSKHATKGRTYQLLKPFLGEGLLISNDQKWQHRRRILTPAFHFGVLQKFLPVFRSEQEKLRLILDNAAENDLDVDLVATMSSFTLNTICETSMGVKLDSISGADQYRKNIYDIGDTMLERYLKPWLHNTFVYKFSLNRLRMNALLQPVHRFTRNVIKLHRQSSFMATKNNDSSVDKATTFIGHSTADNIYDEKKQRFAMLDTLLSAEAQGAIDAEGIREEVDTFMFEGHDTTSCALMFICLVLAHHPDVQDRVHDEIKALIESNDGQALTMANYNQMDYTERVIKECMRLYPPVPFIARVLTEDIRIETGHVIPKGTECHMHIFDLHRDEEQFKEPDKFDPDRFLPEEVEKRHPFAYLPFSAGPRNCIAQKFAMLEVKSCLEDILMRFQIRPVTKLEDVVFIGDLVLRSQSPIKVKMVKRCEMGVQ